MNHQNIFAIDNVKNVFVVFDLDGTLVDTENIHYQSYKTVLYNYGKELARDFFYDAINTGSIEDMLKTLFIDEREFASIRKAKNAQFSSTESIKFINGADVVLDHCLQKGFNIAIVTNSSAQTVEFMKMKLPLLNAVRQWVTRGDYVSPKPASDCYTLALAKYYKNEKNIIGFENSYNGFKAFNNIVNIGYFISKQPKKHYEDINAIYIDDFSGFIC